MDTTKSHLVARLFGSSMTRRQALRGLVAGAAALTAGDTLAQQAATPSPPAKQTFVGLIARANRMFEAPDPRPDGAGFISVLVAVFDTAEHAAVAFPDLTHFFREYLYRDQTTSAAESLELVPAADIGDEAVAYTGKTDSSTNMGIFSWRVDTIVYQSFALSTGGDPLPDLFAVGRTITGRNLNDDPVRVPTAPHEMHTGGVWDLLPTLADVPAGFRFLQEAGS